MYEQIELWPDISKLEQEYYTWHHACYRLPAGLPASDDAGEWVEECTRLNSFSQFLAERNARMQGEPKEPI